MSSKQTGGRLVEQHRADGQIFRFDAPGSIAIGRPPSDRRLGQMPGQFIGAAPHRRKASAPAARGARSRGQHPERLQDAQHFGATL